MKVKSNLNISDLPEWLLEYGVAEFNVYGIYFYNNTFHYLLKNNEHSNFPVLEDSRYFDVIDNRMSSHWVVHPDLEKQEFTIMCREWLEFADEHMHFFTNPDDFEDNIEILAALDSFGYWVRILDQEFDGLSEK